MKNIVFIGFLIIVGISSSRGEENLRAEKLTCRLPEKLCHTYWGNLPFCAENCGAGAGLTQNKNLETTSVGSSCVVSSDSELCYFAYQRASSLALKTCHLETCRIDQDCHISRTVSAIRSEVKNNDKCFVEVDYTLTCSCPF